MITAALPTYNNSNIIWIQLSALCAQKNAPEWELIVCEEESENYLGVNGLKLWVEKLKKANCKRIVYLSLDKWVSLGQKWMIIRDNMHPESKGMMLCASDNHSSETRIKDTYSAIKDGFEWVQWDEGYFYNIVDHKAGMFQAPINSPGLFMCASTIALNRVVENQFPRRGVDTWLMKKIIPKSEKRFCFSDGIHTDGMNTISHNRRNLYNTESSGMFLKVDEDEVFELFPEEIQKRLLTIRK